MGEGAAGAAVRQMSEAEIAAIMERQRILESRLDVVNRMAPNKKPATLTPIGSDGGPRMVLLPDDDIIPAHQDENMDDVGGGVVSMDDDDKRPKIASTAPAARVQDEMDIITPRDGDQFDATIRMVIGGAISTAVKDVSETVCDSKSLVVEPTLLFIQGTVDGDDSGIYGPDLPPHLHDKCAALDDLLSATIVDDASATSPHPPPPSAAQTISIPPSTRPLPPPPPHPISNMVSAAASDSPVVPQQAAVATPTASVGEDDIKRIRRERKQANDKRYREKRKARNLAAKQRVADRIAAGGTGMSEDDVDEEDEEDEDDRSTAVDLKKTKKKQQTTTTKTEDKKAKKEDEKKAKKDKKPAVVSMAEIRRQQSSERMRSLCKKLSKMRAAAVELNVSIAKTIAKMDSFLQKSSVDDE